MIEDGPSQLQTQGEDIEEEDERPQRKRKPEGGNPSAGGGDDDDDGIPTGDVPDDGVDPLAGFGDQPLDKTQSGKIDGLASDWTIVIGNHRKWYRLLNDVGATLAEFVEGEEGDKVSVISWTKQTRRNVPKSTR